MTNNNSILYNLDIDPKKKESKKSTPISHPAEIKKTSKKLPIKLASLSLISGLVFAILIYIFIPFSLLEKAKRGDLNAQYEHALNFFEQENYDQYLYWMKKSAEQTNVRANFHLGIFYKDSIDHTNNNNAEKYLKIAADADSSQAQLVLGKMYKDGLSTKQDYKLARFYLQKSADKGNTEASFFMATFYALGKGGEQDYNKAYIYAKKCSKDSENPLIKLIESKIKKK